MVSTRRIEVVVGPRYRRRLTLAPETARGVRLGVCRGPVLRVVLTLGGGPVLHIVEEPVRRVTGPPPPVGRPVLTVPGTPPPTTPTSTPSPAARGSTGGRSARKGVEVDAVEGPTPSVGPVDVPPRARVRVPGVGGRTVRRTAATSAGSHYPDPVVLVGPPARIRRPYHPKSRPPHS